MEKPNKEDLQPREEEKKNLRLQKKEERKRLRQEKKALRKATKGSEESVRSEYLDDIKDKGNSGSTMNTAEGQKVEQSMKIQISENKN